MSPGGATRPQQAAFASAPAIADADSREFWREFFRGLELKLAAATRRSELAEHEHAGALEHWSASARRRRHLAQQLHRLLAHVYACQDDWAINTPPRSQLLETWACLTEARQHCTDHGIAAHELARAFEFVESVAGAGALDLRAFAQLLETHGSDLDRLHDLLDSLWHNPGDVNEHWRGGEPAHGRYVSGALGERLLQAEAQLQRLQAQALALRPLLLPLAAEDLLAGTDDPATVSARLATARLLLQSEPEELVGRYRTRVIQVFDELLQEKRRQLHVLQTARARAAWRVLRQEGTRFTDLLQLTADVGRDPLLGMAGLFRGACLALAALALAGAAVAGHRGEVLPVVATVGLGIAALLLAAWCRHSSVRFQRRVLENVVDLDEELTAVERQLHAR